MILDQHNYDAMGTGYATRWINFATGRLLRFAGSKEDCFDGGFANYGFTNQGQYIAGLVSAEQATG